jgi:uncharacterized membrane protein YphA (DoxX/SURF4 family)
MLKKSLDTDHAKTTLLIRLMVGIVFVSEGIQKFLFPVLRGAGRFETIGLPWPEFLGPFVGTFEIICGALILIGLFTRFAGIPLTIIMLFALFTTKVDIFMEKGFWEMMHDARTDLSMLLGSLFLIIRGGGIWSFDLLLYSSLFK